MSLKRDFLLDVQRPFSVTCLFQVPSRASCIMEGSCDCLLQEYFLFPWAIKDDSRILWKLNQQFQSQIAFSMGKLLCLPQRQSVLLPSETLQLRLRSWVYFIFQMTKPLLVPLHAWSSQFLTIPFPMPFCLKSLQTHEETINWNQRDTGGAMRGERNSKAMH